MNESLKYIIVILFVLITANGCVSVAKLSDFSQTSTTIDFDKLSKEFKPRKTLFWTSSPVSEYYFEKETSLDEAKIVELIKNVLNSCGYQIMKSNIDNKCIIGNRGWTLNEWSTITAVYYKLSPNKIQIYLNTRISQDGTGGSGRNRARGVGQQIAEKIKNQGLGR